MDIENISSNENSTLKTINYHQKYFSEFLLDNSDSSQCLAWALASQVMSTQQTHVVGWIHTANLNRCRDPAKWEQTHTYIWMNNFQNKHTQIYEYTYILCFCCDDRHNYYIVPSRIRWRKNSTRRAREAWAKKGRRDGGARERERKRAF